MGSGRRSASRRARSCAAVSCSTSDVPGRGIVQCHKPLFRLPTAHNETEDAAPRREVETPKEQRKKLLTRIRVADLPEGENLDTLREAERLFLYIGRMIVYRADTRMMPAGIGAQD